MTLPTRQLGKDGPQVTAIGLGLMGLSAFYGPPKPDAERLALLDAAYDMGERFWDTSDMYGDNEDLLGRWFTENPEKRKHIFLASKFAFRTGADGKGYVDSTPEYAKEACAKSLRRLKIDHIDLYYAHRLDKKTPVELTVRAMKELKEQGKIHYLGISECSSDSLRRAHAVHPIAAVQLEYSAFETSVESNQTGLLSTCRELGVTLVAYSPVGRGMLTGAIKSPKDFAPDDFRTRAPRFSPENFHKNLELVHKFEEIAKKKGITPAQLALAWLLHHGPDVIPIPGTTKVDRLKENVGSLSIDLSDVENEELRRAVDDAEPAGERYPAATMASVYADTPPLKE